MSDVTPKAMVKASYMEKRNQRFAAMSQTARRVKIEQNHTWRIRLLPVEMGPDKEPFVDIAQHWWAKQPITCPRHTAEAWGGNPDYDCPVCAISERLRESSDEAISDMGYKARCNLRVRAWCIVFDQEDARGDVQDMTMAEILNPYEFEMYKTTWESFAKFQKWATSGRRGGNEGSELGLLDLETGCDLLATQGAKGVTLDRCDPGSIFPLNDPKFDDYLAKIWSRIHKPQIIIPSEKDLFAVADKIEEYAQGGGRRRGGDDDGGRGRGRFGGGGGGGRDRDPEPDRGSRGGSRRSRFEEDQDAGQVAPSRGISRRAPEPQNDPVPAQEAPQRPPQRRAPEPEPQQEAPQRRRAPEPQAEQEQPQQHEQEQEAPQTPPRRSAPQQQRRAPEPQAEVEQAEPEADQEAPAPAPMAPPPTRRGAPMAPPPARKTQQPAATNGDADGDVAPQRPPQRRAAAPAPAEHGVDAEEDNAPEERRDPAPAAREPVDDPAPPPVSASAPAPKRSVGDTSDIKARLDKLNSRGR